MAEVSRHQREPMLDRGGGDPAILVADAFPSMVQISRQIRRPQLDRPVHRQPLDGGNKFVLKPTPERRRVVTTHGTISELEQGHLAGKGRTLIQPLDCRRHASVRRFPDQLAEHVGVEQIHGSGIGERI